MSYLLPVKGAIFNSGHFHTSGSLRSRLGVSNDPNDMGIAVGISLLSCIQDEINVMSDLLPVKGAIFES